MQVWLTENFASVLGKLHTAGLEPSAGQLNGKTLVGKISIEKLQVLARISEVKFVSAVRK